METRSPEDGRVPVRRSRTHRRAESWHAVRCRCEHDLPLSAFGIEGSGHAVRRPLRCATRALTDAYEYRERDQHRAATHYRTYSLSYLGTHTSTFSEEC